MKIALRPAGPDDDPLLYRLYRGSREEEMAGWGWDETQRETFLRLQHRAQRGQYETQFPNADHRIILRDDQPVGRILIDESEAEFCLVDIVLMPDHRGAGIGSSLIRDLLSRAGEAGKPVVLSVTRDNPALALYERLGFAVIGDDGVYLRLRRAPEK